MKWMIKSWKLEKVEEFLRSKVFHPLQNISHRLDVLKRSHLEEYRETSPEHFSSLAIDRAMSLIQDLRGTFK